MTESNWPHAKGTGPLQVNGIESYGMSNADGSWHVEDGWLFTKRHNGFEQAVRISEISHIQKDMQATNGGIAGKWEDTGKTEIRTVGGQRILLNVPYAEMCKILIKGQS